MKNIFIFIIASTVTSCGVSQPGPNISEKSDTTKLISDSKLSGLGKYNETIKGRWVTDKESIETYFYDDFSVDKDIYGSDTSSYRISYKSCESDSSTREQKDEIIYLKLISKDKEEICFSIETLNDSALVLMSLSNGNIWKLNRQNN